MNITGLAGLVGPVVGPISARQSGGAGGVEFIVSDFPYTFAIGGIPFLIAPNPNQPYQRATAEFRKQQFDAGNTAGDQSLTGWWLRGQFSFHTGAGIRFNDAFSDSTTANRYWDGVGVNPWTPGKLTLSGSWSPVVRHGNSTYMIGGWEGVHPTVYYVSSADGKLYSTYSGATPISANPCGGFAPDPDKGGTVFFIDADHIKNAAGTYDSTQSDGLHFQSLWWAHGRLVAVDSEGNWYTYPAAGTGTAQARGDAFWGGNGYSAGWTVCDSPGAIFMARGRTIFKLTLNNDGTVPTLGAPAVAAELPDNEIVTSIAYYLSFLAIVTDRGVRIGLTDSTGNVQYGSTIVDFASSTCRSVAAVGSRVFCTGTRAQDATEQIVCINLAEPTTDQLFAYSVESPVAWGTDANTGIAYSDGKIYSYSDTTFSSLVENAPLPGLSAGASGFIETGYIRFDTMEPKAFHSVRVKVEGDGGSIAVSVIRPGGGVTQIASLPASTQGDYDVPLNMAAPEEYIALRFTLTADASGKTPILSGYQVRALPAPSVRARMISVPLMCHDHETGPQGQVAGHAGWAWERLSLLEDLERDAGIVLFQDLRTGETAQAFIEQIAFQNELPPKGNLTGFGGTITATLRRVS